jgi:flagellar assembly protein FliH
MALDKPIIKAQVANTTTFEYKPRELGGEATSDVAKSFVSEGVFRSSDFRISELVAQQAGISQLHDDAKQDQINTEVLARLAEVQEKSYQEGYELGLIEGTEKAFQEAKVSLLERLSAIEKLFHRIEELKTELTINHEAELVKLVFLTAKRIALRDIAGNREAVLELIKNVVGESQANERVVVHLSTEDLFFIESLLEKSDQRMELLRRVKFVSDENVKSGGCLIETEFGNVDSTLDERVERTWQALQAKIPHMAPNKND